MLSSRLVSSSLSRTLPRTTAPLRSRVLVVSPLKQSLAQRFAPTQRSPFSTTRRFNNAQPTHPPPKPTPSTTPKPASGTPSEVADMTGGGKVNFSELMSPRVRTFVIGVLCIFGTMETYFWCRMIYEKYFKSDPVGPEAETSS